MTNKTLHLIELLFNLFISYVSHIINDIHKNSQYKQVKNHTDGLKISPLQRISAPPVMLYIWFTSFHLYMTISNKCTQLVALVVNEQCSENYGIAIHTECQFHDYFVVLHCSVVFCSEVQKEVVN